MGENDNWREVKAVFVEGSVFNGVTPNGASVRMGSTQDLPGFSPMELILTGIAGCSAMTVASLLRREHQNFVDLRVDVRGQYGETKPRIFTRIEIDFTIIGENLQNDCVGRAIKLSEEKYCNAIATIRPTAEIVSRFQIVKPEIA